MSVFHLLLTNFLMSVHPYMGPETIMPVATILATVIGFLLIFWRVIVRLIKRLFQWLFKRGAKAVGEENVSEKPADTTQENI